MAIALTLTDFERRILMALAALCTERSFPVGLTAITQQATASKNVTVAKALNSLERKGFITKSLLRPHIISSTGDPVWAIRPECRAWLEAEGAA